MTEQNARSLPLQALDADQLDQLVRLIRRNQCALILGPHCTGVEEKGRRISLRSLLARELAEELSKTTGPALPDPYDLPMVSTAYMSRPDVSRSKLEMKVEDFYLRQTEPGPILRQIAHLPFSIILTVSPDTLLQQAFKKEGAQRYAEGYYHLGETQRDNYDENDKISYIYQLFGKEPDSAGSKPALRLLYLYAPEDEALKTALDRHLTALKDKYGFTATGIHDILPGEDVETARRRAVDEAHLIVPLLSADFAANEQLAEALLPRALARHGGERTRVTGVYAKPLDGAADLLQGKAPLLPDADMSIADFASPDRAFQRIAQELEKIIEGMI